MEKTEKRGLNGKDRRSREEDGGLSRQEDASGFQEGLLSRFIKALIASFFLATVALSLGWIVEYFITEIFLPLFPQVNILFRLILSAILVISFFYLMSYLMSSFEEDAQKPVQFIFGLLSLGIFIAFLSLWEKPLDFNKLLLLLGVITFIFLFALLLANARIVSAVLKHHPFKAFILILGMIALLLIATALYKFEISSPINLYTMKTVKDLPCESVYIQMESPKNIRIFRDRVLRCSFNKSNESIEVIAYSGEDKKSLTPLFASRITSEKRSFERDEAMYILPEDTHLLHIGLLNKENGTVTREWLIEVRQTYKEFTRIQKEFLYVIGVLLGFFISLFYRRA